MQTISLYQFLTQKDHFIEEVMQNKLFVYPTDTLYGIGGLFSHENIERISKIKKREMSKKMSIIAPSFEWIFEHFYVSNPEYLLEAFNKYHGVTYILEPKSSISEYSLYETQREDKTIGVRIIKHPFQEFVTYMGKPFISTSVNFAGRPNAKFLAELEPKILESVDYVIDGKEVFGRSSVLVWVENNKVFVRDE